MPRLGRRPPKNAPALYLSPLLTGVVPAHPAAQDNLGALTGWHMLGNDAAGDCVAVTWANFRRLVTAALAGREVYPTQAQVWDIYKTQNPDFDPNGDPNVNGPGSAADGGMEIQTLLEYLVKTGGPDGVKALAFAKVDYTNLDEVKAALSIFGGVWSGLNVQAANQEQFAASQPWNYVSGSPVEGGHSVLSGGYSGRSAGDIDFITWAAETSFTDAFVKHLMEEMWVVVWPEHLGSKAFQQGVDLTALAADYEALTGRPFPVQPTPGPTPTPVPPGPDPGPAPDPDPADVALVTALRHWLVEHHDGDNHRAQRAVEAWMTAKHLT